MRPALLLAALAALAVAPALHAQSFETLPYLLGRRVAVLVDGEAEAGRHAAVLNGRGLASGTYVVRLVAGGQAFTQRVTLVR